MVKNPTANQETYNGSGHKNDEKGEKSESKTATIYYAKCPQFQQKFVRCKNAKKV